MSANSSPNESTPVSPRRKQNGTRFGRPPVDPAVVAEKLEIAPDARAKGRTAEAAAALVGWSRATLYRHRQATLTRDVLSEQV